MIVDSDEVSTLLLKEVLNMVLPGDAQYNIISTASGKDAITLCRNQSVSLVFTELRLKDMGGLEMTRKIKEMDSKIQIIMQTAALTDDTESRAFEAGCDKYLTKPINIKDIEDYLKNFLMQLS